MDKDKNIKIENYFEFLLLLILLFLVFLLMQSFIVALLFGIIFTFMFYKPYKYLLEKTKKPNLSAALICLIVVLILFLPVYFIVTSLIDQTTYMVDSSEELIMNFKNQECVFSACDFIKNKISLFENNIENYLNDFATYLYGTFSEIFNSISKLAINFFIFILALYFLLVDGETFLRYVKRILPLKSDHKNALFLRFRQVSSAVFTGSLLVAVIQGILLGIGFWIFGLPSPIFWSIVTMFFALIPVVGTAVVWVPVFLYFLLTSQYLLATGFFFWGAIMVGLSDNLLRPYFIKRKIEVHPFLILLSIFGGIEVFGFLGIFIGPIIISLLISLLHLYHLDFS